jgi:hypothetical protein
MDGKSPVRSKTLWVGITAFIGGLVALILHYTGTHELTSELVGASWTDLLTSVAMIGLRLATKVPIALSDDSNSGAKGVTVTGILLMVLVATLFCPGCSTLTVHAKDTIGVEIANGPPCRVSVSADGEVVATVVGPKACKVGHAR